MVIGFVRCSSIALRSNSVNNLRSTRTRPSSTSPSPLSPDDENVHQQLLVNTTTPTLPSDSSGSNSTGLISSSLAAVKVVPAIIAPSSKSLAYSNTNSSNAVQVITADTVVDVVSTGRPQSFNDTVTLKTTTNKPAALSFRERLALSNLSTVRPNKNRPVNASQLFPKRTLLSPTMSRYLAKAKAATTTLRPVSSSSEASSAHSIVKRHVIPLMSLDDFVLDIDDKL